jgi:hypothetical protein
MWERCGTEAELTVGQNDQGQHEQHSHEKQKTAKTLQNKLVGWSDGLNCGISLSTGDWKKAASHSAGAALAKSKS